MAELLQDAALTVEEQDELAALLRLEKESDHEGD